MTCKQYTDEAHNVLSRWKENNKQKLQDYYRKHGWLRQDIEKLEECQREHRLVVVALTDTKIYGYTIYGNLFITGRFNFGIAPNFD